MNKQTMFNLKRLAKNIYSADTRKASDERIVELVEYILSI